MPIFVNEVEITDEQVFTEMQHHPAANQGEALEKAAKALAIRELLLQEAQSLGIHLGIEQGDEAIDGDPHEPMADDARIEALLIREIVLPTPDEASLRRYYDNNRASFTRHENGGGFDDVKALIAEYLQASAWQISVTQYIKLLAGQAKIIGVQLEGVSSPLVQ